jgi:ribosome assembly protein 4
MPPIHKKSKILQNDSLAIAADAKIQVEFQNDDENITTSTLVIPLNSSVKQLELLLNQLLENEEKMKFSFWIADRVIGGNLREMECSTEEKLVIKYRPEAVFRVGEREREREKRD